MQQTLWRQRCQVHTEMNFHRDEEHDDGVKPGLTRRELLARLAKVAGASSLGGLAHRRWDIGVDGGELAQAVCVEHLHDKSGSAIRAANGWISLNPHD